MSSSRPRCQQAMSAAPPRERLNLLQSRGLLKPARFGSFGVLSLGFVFFWVGSEFFFPPGWVLSLGFRVWFLCRFEFRV